MKDRKIRYSLVCDVRQRKLVASCRRFGSSYLSDFQESSSLFGLLDPWKMEPMGCPDMLLSNYKFALFNILEERSLIYTAAEA